MSKCPFHRMLKGLRVFAGLPVPVTAKWIDGKPDFRQTDHAQVIRCVRYDLCGVCGRKLGLSAFWIGGLLCQQHHYFVDPAMHQECALESMRLCPFLNGQREQYRGELPHVAAQLADGRPERMFLFRSRTDAMGWRKFNGDPLIYAGDQLVTVKEF